MAAASENPDDPGLGPKAYDMRVLGILNQVVQEPVVRIEKKDIPLPLGTITIQPTGEGKCLIRGEVLLGFLFLFLFMSKSRLQISLQIHVLKVCPRR